MSPQLRHTGIVVSDLAAALRFYGDLLSFRVVRRMEEQGAALDNVLALENARVTTVKMAASDGGQIELLYFTSPDRQPSRRKAPQVDALGPTHIALTVADLDATYRRLASAGVAFNAPPQISADGRTKLTYCRDPDGSFVELVEMIDGVFKSAVASNPASEVEATAGFAEVTEIDYFDLLVRRLKGEDPELTFLAQFRDLLAGDLRPGARLLDVGCATGYGFNAFRQSGVSYTGIDIEERYLEAAREWFADEPRARFARHDITQSAGESEHDIVVCDAVLEHLPGLLPALSHIAASARRTVLVRTFMGTDEEICTRPVPNPAYAASHRKYSNQYAFHDVLGALATAGFEAAIVRDRYTDSLPRWVDGGARTFFIACARRA